MFSVTAQTASSAPTESKYTMDTLVKLYGEEAIEFNFDGRTLENIERLVLMHLARGLVIKKPIQKETVNTISNEISAQTPPVSTITDIEVRALLIGVLLKPNTPGVGLVLLIDNTVLVKKINENDTNYNSDRDPKVLENVKSFREAKSHVDTEQYVVFGETALRGSTESERKDVMGFLKETLKYLADEYKQKEKFKSDVGNHFNNDFKDTFKNVDKP